MIKNLRISSKLYAGFGIVILLAMLMAGMNYYSYEHISDETQATSSKLYPVMKAANNIYIHTLQVQQWVTDISATRGKDGYDDGLTKAKEHADGFKRGIDELIVLDPAGADGLRAMLEPFDEYYTTGVRLANAYINGGPESGNKLMDEFDSDAEAILTKVTEYYSNAEAQFEAGLVSIDDKATQATQLGIILTVIVLCMGVFVAFYIARLIATPLKNMAEVAEALALGDLSKKVNVESTDEVGMLAASFMNMIEYMKSLASAAEKIANNDLRVRIEAKSERDELGNSFDKMVSNLTTMIKQLKGNSTELASASTEVSSSSEQMSAGASNQAQQTSQVSVAVEEMTATIVEASKNASDASQLASSASSLAENGRGVVAETIDGLREIGDSSKKSGAIMNELATASDKIGEIISVIDDIADQTNLLALNAAIEAARAGEQGRGFAVVADEVRKLAERTTVATGEIAAMIKGIQNDSKRAVSSMEDAEVLVTKGQELADKAGNTLTEINDQSRQLMDMIAQIASATEQQSAAAEQISRNIESISSVTKETAAGAEQSATAAEEMSRQAEGLQSMVGAFSLTE